MKILFYLIYGDEVIIDLDYQFPIIFVSEISRNEKCLKIENEQYTSKRTMINKIKTILYFSTFTT